MPTMHPHLSELEVPIIVELGRRTMTVREVMMLLPGAILELPKSADEHLELLANNRPVATGTAVKVGENFGLRITAVGSAAERAAAAAAADDISDDEAEALAAQLLAGQ
ncbi:MAG: FliM/FliN family flagellar motor switch protein [Phycisphaeraceae bacterium]|nr:MAG: FliM/FliN family flagellar motor switch protein [Phycisphaeraceae bacterium]